MSLRWFAGLLNGSYVVRIARPGFNAKTDNPNDPERMAFATDGAANLLVSEIVLIDKLNKWVPFAKTYTDIPKPLYTFKRGSSADHLYLPFENLATYYPTVAVTTYGSPYTPVVKIDQIMIATTTAPNAVSEIPLASGDQIACYMVA